MIAREHRFHGHNSLKYVYRHGAVIRGPWFSLKYTPNTKRDSYRAAVVVSRKISKSAPPRNRIRRRMYELIREFAPGFTNPYDIVFTIFSEQVAELPSDQLRSAVEGQLKKAGILAKTKRRI